MDSHAAKQLVEMVGVYKSYPSFSMRDFELALPEGEIMGLIGPNGAGKSTCLRMIMGFLQPDAGTINVLGRPVAQGEGYIKQHTAYVAEDMRLFDNKSLQWHMAFVARFFPSWNTAYANHLIKRFELNISTPVKTFSLGQRVKATLLLALARKPKLLILDEPSTGLDPIARYELTSELFEIMLNDDHSVLFSSQYTQDVERLSDTIAFMDQGALISCQDKETYLERWRRITVTAPESFLPWACEHLPAFERNGNQYYFSHGHYCDELKASLRAVGAEVISVTPMSLEEIFINQIISRRSLRQGVQAA